MSNLKSSVTAWILFIGVCAFAQTNKTEMDDLPANPQAGHCYIRCFEGDNEKPAWKDIDCAFIEYQKLEISKYNALSEKEKKSLKKLFKKFIRKGYSLKLDSYDTSGKSKEENMSISRDRVIEVANYLVEIGYNPDKLKVNVYGNKDQKTGVWYRAINGVSAD